VLKATTTTTPAELQQRWETAVAEVLRKAEQAERKARGKRLTWLRQEQERWARLADRAARETNGRGGGEARARAQRAARQLRNLALIWP
jgi:hypothetical protein